MKKLIKKLTNSNLVVGLLILILTVLAVLSNVNELFKPIDKNAVSDLYANSQYVLGDASQHWVTDGTVYRYAAIDYLNGHNPTQVNFEHPPLGKYLFSLSIVLFNNPVSINILIYIFVLVNFYLLTLKITNSKPTSLIGLIILGLSSLLRAHLGYALLGLQMLAWTLLFFNLLLTNFKNIKLKYALLGLSLGGLATTKYYFPLILLYLLCLGIYWFKKDKRISLLLITGLSTAVIYLLSYSAFFLNGNSLIDLVKFELYRFDWWTGNRDFPRFLILANIYLGRFKVWWTENSYEYAPHWDLTWPILLTLNLLLAPFQKWNFNKLVVFLFPTLLLALLAIGGANNSRYVLQLLPFWIIFTISGLKQLLVKFNLVKPDKQLTQN